jgi:serine/threonine protein phosphatase PrpC
MKIGLRSDVGMIRENNEDSFIVDDEIGLFLVADGVGGHQAGEIASKTGSEAVHEIIRAKLSGQKGHPLETLIKEAIDHAHKVILSQASSNPYLNGMGTTIVLGLYQNGRLYIAHVGDSRAYLINTNSISLLTQDHSLVGSLIRAGKITHEEARNHKMRHIITQCLGSNEYFGPEIKNLECNEGDILLICSDGLTNMVEDHIIQMQVSKNKTNLQRCADILLELANKRGGSDNITLILVEMQKI